MSIRIKNWESVFESAESRRHKTLAWVAVPTRMTGRGFRRVVNHPEGARILGAWLMIVEVAATCPKRGTLSSADGAFTTEDLSLITGLKVEDFNLALSVLCSPSIGWVVVDDECDKSTHPVTPGQTRADPGNAGLQDKTRQDITDKTNKGGKSPAEAVEHPAETAKKEIPQETLSLAFPDKDEGKVSTEPQKRDSVNANGQETPLANQCPHSEIMALWNSTVSGVVPKITIMSPARKVAVKNMWAEFGGSHNDRMNQTRELFAAVMASDFCRGASSSFVATFDWTIKPANRVKIIEGNYANRKPSAPTPEAKPQPVINHAAYFAAIGEPVERLTK